MSKNLEEMIKDVVEKGQLAIVGLGGNVKSVVEDSLALSETKAQLNESLIELGMAVYNEYSEKPDSAVYEKFSPLFKELEVLAEQADELETELNKSFGKKSCPNCDYKIGLDARFCPNCGLEYDVEEDEEDESDLICLTCGTEHEEGQKFCKECGAKLSE